MNSRFSQAGKLMLAAMLLLLLSFSTGAPAHASIQAADRGTIRVTGLESGLPMTVAVYDVVDVDFDYVTQTLNGYAWHPSVVAYAGAQTPETVGAASAVDFMDGLAAHVVVNGVSPLQTVSSTTGDVTIPNLELGTYLLLVSGGTRFYRPIAASVEAVKGNATGLYNMESPEIVAKSIDPQLVGTINEAQVSGGHVPTVFDTAAMGEVLTIDVTGDIPSYPAGSTHTSLSLSHMHGAGVTYDSYSFQLFGVASDGGETLLRENLDYTFTENSTLNTWNAHIMYDRVKGYAKLHAQFFIKLNQGAVIGDPSGNESITTYTYTADPLLGTERAKSVTLRAYTYGMQITAQYQSASAVRPLPGARYQLRRSAEEELSALTLSIAEIGGKTVFVVDPAGTINTMASDASGEITLYGVGEGRYYLVEVTAPYGFNQMIRPHSVVIAKQGVSVPHLLQAAGSNVLGVHHLTESHTRSVSMPAAGGRDAPALYLSGMMLILLAICGYSRHRRTQG